MARRALYDGKIKTLNKARRALYDGKIKTLNKAKGFGFIVSDSFDTDIWFNTQDVPNVPEDQLRGHPVRFEAATSRDNKVRATKVEVAQESDEAAATGEEDPWGAATGASQEGEDASNEMWQQMMLQLGLDASTMLGVDAASVQGMLAGMDQPDETNGTDDQSWNSGQIESFDSSSRASTAQAQSPSGPNYGVIQRLNKEKGFGFISSPSFQGNDVWFNTNSLPHEYEEESLKGASVCFEAAFTKDDPPRIRATTVHLLIGDGSLSPVAPVPSTHSSVPGQTGVIKTFNGTYGFIVSNSPEMQLDGIYFKSQDLADLSPDQATKGLPVVFDLVFHKDGKPQGKNVRFGAGGSESSVTISSGGWGTKRPAESGWDTQEPAKRRAPAVPEGTTLTGTIKRFRPIFEDEHGGRKGGYGFISCEEVPGEDIWFSQGVLPVEDQVKTEQELVGASVHFTVKCKPDGKLAASALSL